ncbi:MAG: hypothetical protein M1838_004478 [Thelocarpon superellum]|nr:MAG: hypothetical protein M1838_004478 [Thelocarpon superellum]
MVSQRQTLIRPPPLDPAKSSMENALDLLRLSDIGPDIFTNAQPLWRPIGARGIFGGCVIAQCLGAAQLTVPEDFNIHSMHCYFVLAGDPDIPILYHVERVRDGKSFATRTVQARQRGKCVFTTTCSFVKENSGGKKTVEHSTPMPAVEGPFDDDPEIAGVPFQNQQVGILNEHASMPHVKKTRQWVKATGKISAAGGHQAHLNALAYVSDSNFLHTISRVHGLSKVKSRQNAGAHGAQSERDGGGGPDLKPEIGMIVSLDHTIFFHRPRAFRADEWMLSEMEVPWAGDGRGLVLQRMFTRDGQLVATCVQEGLIRLRQEPEPSKSKL